MSSLKTWSSSAYGRDTATLKNEVKYHRAFYFSERGKPWMAILFYKPSHARRYKWKVYSAGAYASVLAYGDSIPEVMTKLRAVLALTQEGN